jgi:hypothetical protein
VVRDAATVSSRARQQRSPCGKRRVDKFRCIVSTSGGAAGGVKLVSTPFAEDNLAVDGTLIGDRRRID